MKQPVLRAVSLALVVGLVLGISIAVLRTTPSSRGSPQDPYFDGPHNYQMIDTDLDGDTDSFRVNARVTLPSVSSYTVSIRAFVRQIITTTHPSDANLTTAQYIRGPIMEINTGLNYGSSTYALTEDARPFYLSGYTGVWDIYLVMSDAETGQQYSTDSLSTSSLSWSSFDPTEVDLTASATDYAIDLTGDGKMDVLKVNVTFTVAVMGTYGVNAFLYTNNWTTMFATASVSPSSYGIGATTRQVTFDVTCCQSYVGPFRVWVRIGESGPTASAILYDEQTYNTVTTGF